MMQLSSKTMIYNSNLAFIDYYCWVFLFISSHGNLELL